jgi:CRISPR-associated protein Csb2
MSARALLIELCLMDGRYHGIGDWPPAPFRLFQALVAGAYGSRWQAEAAVEKDAAFRWLERLPPPHIAAPAKTEARATTYFVPNNDLDAVGGDPARVSEIRAGKVLRPIMFDAARPLLYAWRFEDDNDHALRLCALAERLHTFGRGIDAAFASGQVVTWDEALARLAASQSIVAKPVGLGGADDLTCPVGGSLDSLKHRYAALARRFELRRDGRTMLTLFRQPPKPQFRTIAYERPPKRLLFELRSSGDPARFRSIVQERVVEVAKAVRDLTTMVLNQSFPQRAAEIKRFVVGCDAGPADVTRRVRFVPLPSIGFMHADPAIRRVLIEIPPDCPIAAETIAWAVSGRSLPGFERVDAETGEVLEETILSPTGDTTMLAHYGIGARATRRWHTITPVALPEPRPRGRVRGSQRAASEQRAAAAVAQALRHVGRDFREIDVRTQSEPFHLKGARADAFAPDRFGDRLRHVEVVFSEPALGPLVIGDGRYLGLGLMAPAREVLRDVFVFMIPKQAKITCAERSALMQAVRRALMALSRDIQGETRRLFSGHEQNGGPAAFGRHEHVFLAADDSDGDGRIDRLIVAAPWVCDRSMRPNRGMRRDFDRVVSHLETVRAGRLGVIALGKPMPVANDDPLAAPSRAWQSRTPYRATRHAGRRKDPKAALVRDLVSECMRRGFPKPEVEILELSTVPNGGGLTAQARLHFAVAVRGPLLLGRDSHRGGGLFAAIAGS